MIAIIDYGMGNLRSVAQALKKVGGENVLITAEAAEIERAERVVFPGQGAMPDCMAEIDRRGLRQTILHAAANKPFLGICLGLQMLFDHSDEGDVAGLQLWRGDVKRFANPLSDHNGQILKVPHMGWNSVNQCQPHPLWNGIENNSHFYFVHSYHVVPAEAALVGGVCDYGGEFTCVSFRDNVFAVQFHPEKSARDGLRLLENFVSWQP